LYVANIVLNYQVNWFSTFWYMLLGLSFFRILAWKCLFWANI